MTTQQIRKIEKIADESALYARRALGKSEELRAFLSLLEYKSGKKRSYASVDSLFKKLRIS